MKENEINWEAAAEGDPDSYYLRAEDNEAKARVLDRMNQFLPLHIQNNFGVMANLLFGEL